MGKRIILSWLWVLLPVMLPAQQDSLHLLSIADVYRQNYWLTAHNAIGLSFNRFHSFSIVQAGYGYSNHNPETPGFPTSSNRYFVDCTSYQKIGKASFYGNLSYTLDQDHQLSWNGMTNHYWQAIRLCDSISGNRHVEKYQLKGAFSLPIRGGWLAGAEIIYNVRQTAKDTDPRNKNQWMTWQLTPGVGYQCGNVRLGASLFYGVKKEEVDYRNMGLHNDYPILTVYPTGYYKSLPKGTTANWYYTGKETGGDLQADIPLGSFRFFQQIHSTLSKQDVISNRIQNHKEAHTDGWKITYRAHLQRQTPHTRHEWTGYFVLYSADNYDPLQEQTPGGTWQSQGKVLRSTARAGLYSVKYKYHRLNDKEIPHFTLSSGITYHHAENTLLFYPHEYTQTFHRFTVHSTTTKVIPLQHAQLKLTLGGLCGTSEQWGVHSSLTYTHTGSFRWFARLLGTYQREKNTTYKKIQAHIGWIF